MLELEKLQALEALFMKKIVLYTDLRNCLEKEREYLIQMDLDSLWKISREKESLCADLESTREELLIILNRDKTGPFPGMSKIIALIPKERKLFFQDLFYSVSTIQSDIENFRTENVKYVEESLQFIDEMIAVMAGESHNSDVYDRKCRLKKVDNSLLLRGEV